MFGKITVFRIGLFIGCGVLMNVAASVTKAQQRVRISAPASLLEILDKDDRDCVLTNGGLRKSATVQSIRLVHGTRQLLVRGSGSCLCGAQNCGFWVYRKNGSKYELLLEGAGSIKVSAARTSANGYRDIVSQSHASAAETIIRTYRYDGSRYQLLNCVNRAYYDDRGKYTRYPTNRPCGEASPDETAIEVPANLLNQELTTIDNRQIKLSDYAGRPIIVSLFASWCAPCRQNIWDLNVIKKNLTKDVVIIGVVARENDPRLEDLRLFTKSLNIDFPVTWEDVGFTDRLSSLIQGLHVLPQVFIIDGAGRLRKHFRGFNSEQTPALLREALDEVRTPDSKRTP
jgi:peroxiredoxin